MSSFELPMDWDGIMEEEKKDSDVHAENASDALIFSLTERGRVDVGYISSITGMDAAAVIAALKGSIYQNPDKWNGDFREGWETSEEYLSGNLMRKWRAAKDANEKYPDRFDENLKAIEKILPPTVASKDIYVTLGSPWVPSDIIDDFIVHLFGNPLDYWTWKSEEEKDRIYDKYFRVRHDTTTGTWEIQNKTRFGSRVSVYNTYGTKRLGAMHIIEKTLNMKTVVVMDEIDSQESSSGKKKVVNKTETVAAVEKQHLLIKEFQDWIWTDSRRKERLEIIFENKYSCARRRIFDGSFLKFPGMSSKVKLYPYQKNAVARMLFTPNTLLAHDVGSGKTYEMIAAGQELRRMGLSRKNMYVVPNNIVSQWRDIFLEMYPSAKLLCVDPKCFTPKKRRRVLEKIRDEEYDGIIIAYSCFELIPLSKKYNSEDIREQRNEITWKMAQKSYISSSLKKKREKLDKSLKELSESEQDAEDGIFFDDLGINRLFVDEAHNFKNVPVETKVRSVLGISSAGSKKCREMMDKVRMIQKNNDGKGVVMATGTPITNSITDVYVMQKYLQNGELELLDLQSFDSWIGMFAERRTEFEIDVDTGSYRLATRFARFHNLPELTVLLSSIADFHQTDGVNGIPMHDGYEDTLVERTPDFEAYLKVISKRADDVRHGVVNRREDNMLKITTDGRKAALDMRLVDPEAGFCSRSKVEKCAQKAADIYRKTADFCGTQLIFCDSSTPKEGFNIYSELKKRLIGLGVREDEIAFVHDAETEKQRSCMFERMRNGGLRILIGSTFKLGLGVNVQDRLFALHHIDVPWRPADMTQREGRILRQGNTNEQVYIFRYITEGSFDAYSWQLLETKQNFISALLSGSLNERSGSDIDDIVLNYAEVKALAIGNPLIKKRVETANELSRYRSLQKKHTDARICMEKELMEIPARIEAQKKLTKQCEEDTEFENFWIKNHAAEYDASDKKEESEKRKLLREALFRELNGHVAENSEKKFGSYRGFDIILPANMTGDKPYVLIRGAGSYYVEMGDSDVGNLIRIDNFLDNLSDHLKHLNAGLSKLVDHREELKMEIEKNDGYADMIEEYKKKLEDIDKELGVEKNE